MAPDNALKTTMKIRHVSANDKSEWIRMRAALWPGSPDDHRVEIDQFFSRPDDDLATFVAEVENGMLCGFLEAGTRTYAEEWARDLGLSKMASDADLANTISHNAHRALGYSEVQSIICFRKSL